MAAREELFANYNFSLTEEQQQNWQLFLRRLPEQLHSDPVFQMLHDLSYVPLSEWTKKPENELWKLNRIYGRAAKEPK